MNVSNYLNFNGQCEEAFTFYAKSCCGDVQSLMRWSEMPGGTSNAAMANKVMHANLKIGTSEILGADAPPDRAVKPAGFNVALNVDSDEEAERIFKALCEGGSVTMAMEETFFASRFGMVTDRFGIPWIIVRSKG
jgi:PhnB protein